VMLWSAESEHPRLIRFSHEIIFEEFQPLCDHVTPTSQADKRTTCRIAMPRTA